jgi:hypothetical protein
MPPLNLLYDLGGVEGDIRFVRPFLLDLCSNLCIRGRSSPSMGAYIVSTIKRDNH